MDTKKIINEVKAKCELETENLLLKEKMNRILDAVAEAVETICDELQKEV